ncbi:hypothetical protein [Pleomorphomonas sp. PLEO]|uniref:hypothetical protein n=1 Tax=Pleomorphomonas sp. PLEO TaxID=3239306 RepID=UPI00351F082C
MADHPIPLKDFEVRAILDGRKTQKRLVLTPQPLDAYERDVDWWASYEPGTETPLVTRIAVGDHLWARETWRTLHTNDCLAPRHLADDRSKITYEADPERRNPLWSFGKLRPSTHMPRWASRLTLLVTEVRIQRLQDLSEADAIAEAPPYQQGMGTNVSAQVRCMHLWEAENGLGAWSKNPWVVACAFSAAKSNIDHVDDEVEA